MGTTTKGKKARRADVDKNEGLCDEERVCILAEELAAVGDVNGALKTLSNGRKEYPDSIEVCQYSSELIFI